MVIIIPARYESTRFPGKPLAILAGQPMIKHVYDNAIRVSGANEVYVATDDKRIADVVSSFGGKPILTSANHSCGTDRVNECAVQLGIDSEEIVVNIQGDEPFLPPEAIEELVSAFDDESVVMASLMKPLHDDDMVRDQNVVKVVVDATHNALYFSRCPIPFNRDNEAISRWAHVGVYAYRFRILNEFVHMPKSSLERAESLEQLRALESGIKIRMVKTEYNGFGIDTPEQLERADSIMRAEI